MRFTIQRRENECALMIAKVLRSDMPGILLASFVQSALMKVR